MISSGSRSDTDARQEADGLLGYLAVLSVE